MAIAYGAAGTALNQTTAATTFAVAYPASVAANDLLVLHVVTNGGAVTTPAGWTAIYNEATVVNPKGGLFIKKAAGGETGTLSVTTASTTGVAQMHKYTGVDTTTQQDAAATSVSLDATTDTTIDIPAITTVTANAWFIYACGSNSTSLTHTAANTERADFAPTNGKAGALYDGVQAAAGTTGVKTITQSAARAYWGAMLVLRPAGSAATSLSPAGIATAEAFGTPTETGTVSASPGGIATVEAFGSTAHHWGQSYNFDDGTAQGWTASTAGAGTVAITAGAAHDGGYGASSDVPAATTDRAGYTRTVPATQQAVVRGWWKVTTEGASASSNVPFARLFDGATRIADVYRQNQQGAGANVWMRIVKAVGGSNYWFIPTGYNLPLDTWVYVSFQWGLDGKPELYLNGTRYIAESAAPADWLAAPQISTAWLGSQEAGNQGAWNIDTVEILGRDYSITGEARNLPIISGEAFGTPARTGSVTATATGIPTAEAFGTATESGALTAAPGGAASAEAYGVPAMSGTLSAAASGIGSGEAFGTASNSGLLVGSPGSILSAEAFGTPAIAANVTQPTGIASSEAFGTPAMAGALTVTATGIGTAEAFGTATETGLLTAAPAGIGSAESFGTPNAGASAVPAGIGSAEAFGTPASILSATLQPAGIPSAELFGAPVMGGNLPTSPTGIATGQAFGTPAATVLAGGQSATATGIGTAEVFGSPAMSGSYAATPSGIGSAETWGTVRAEPQLTASPTSFADPDGFGVPSWSGLWVMQPAGIPSAEIVSNAGNGSTYTVTATGVGSAEAFGTPVELSVLLVAPATITTAEAFGTATETGALTASVVGIATAQAMGFPILTVSVTARAVGIADPDGYGMPTATVLAFTGRDLVLGLEAGVTRWHVRAKGERFGFDPLADRFDTAKQPERLELAAAAGRMDTQGGI